MLLNDCKAGMQGIDKTRIENIIRDNTGANYYSHQRKKQIRIDERIERNRQLLANASTEQMLIAERKVSLFVINVFRLRFLQMDALIEELESARDMSRICVHVDMDAFYAAVEMRDDARLRTIPMAVGSESMLVCV